MQFDVQVTVSEAALTDVIDVVFGDDPDEYEERQVTIGSVVAERLLDRLQADPRWDGLTARFWDAVDEHLAQAAPGFVEAMVAAEVDRQLGKLDGRASVRGKPATRAEAMIATEVTTQLRGQFAPLVEAALTRLDGELRKVADELLRATVAQRYGRPDPLDSDDAQLGGH